MTKYLLITFSILYSLILFGQTSDQTAGKEELFKHLSVEVCECMTNNKDVPIKALNGCLQNNMKKYDEKLKTLINKDSLFYKETSEELGNQFVEAMQIPLVENCDSFYNYFKNMKDNIIDGLYQFKSQQKLDSLNKVNNKDRDNAYYFERGLLNFAHKNNEKSIADIKKSIDLDPKEDYYMFLAWIYTENGNLEKAIENYDNYIELTKSQEMKIMKAVSIREINEMNDKRN